MSDYEIEASDSIVRAVRFVLKSNDGSRRLAYGSVSSSQRVSSDTAPTPDLTLIVYDVCGEETWKKLRTAIDEAFARYRALWL